MQCKTTFIYPQLYIFKSDWTSDCTFSKTVAHLVFNNWRFSFLIGHSVGHFQQHLDSLALEISDKNLNEKEFNKIK